MSAIGRRDVLVLLGGALASGGLGGCSRELGRYRFLYTVRIEVDGQVRSGSSVVEFRADSRIEAHNYALTEFGVSPWIDLGKERGLVLAPLWARYLDKKKLPTGLDYAQLHLINILYELFVPLSERGKWEKASRYLDQATEKALSAVYRPDFIWVPADAATYKDLQLIYSHEFEDVIGAGILYVDCSLKPTRSPLKTQLDIESPWLKSVRSNRSKVPIVMTSIELGERVPSK
jgi:hypothetical protein